jgi:hypothetical protein
MNEKPTRAALQRWRRLIRRCNAEIDLPTDSARDAELRRQLAAEVADFEKIFAEYMEGCQ